MAASTLTFNEEETFHFFSWFYGNLFIYIAICLLFIFSTCVLFYLKKEIDIKMKEIISPQKNDTFCCISIWILEASSWIPWVNLVYTIGSIIMIFRIYFTCPDIITFKKAFS